MESLQRVASQLNKSQNINNNTEDVFSHLKLPRHSTNLTKKTEIVDAPSFHFDAYRDENEKPFVFRSVIKAQQEIVDQKMDKEYSSMEGIATFNTAIQEALFGKHHPLVRDNKIVTFQTLSGQGALRVGLAFLKEHTPGLVYVSDPAGEEYAGILDIVGLKGSQYPYLNSATRELDFDGMCKTLASAKAGSIVLLHASAHGPTGVDPTFEQWRILAKLMKTKGLLPFFESASQGLASGDLETDAKAVHIFLEEGLQLLVAQSFDKTMGLYGERVGALHIVCRSETTAEILSSQLNLTIRCMYGLPPINGARIVDKILRNPQYTAEWKEDLRSVYERVQQMKALLYEELVKENVQGNWEQIKKQNGLYWNMGLSARQNEELVYKHNIYFVKDGRMNMSCINHKNVKFVAQAIKEVTKSTKEEITVLLPSRL